MTLPKPVAALVAVLLLTARADAETVRFPQDHNPAFVIATPDGWTHQSDGQGDMLLVAANHSTSISLSFVSYKGPLDDLAAATMKAANATPPHNAGAARISGYAGAAYDSTTRTPSGATANIHMIAVNLDDGHVATIALMSLSTVTPADYDAGLKVQGGATLTAVK